VKIFVYVIAMAFFVGGIILMGYAIGMKEGMALMFFGGILSVSVSLAIPFNLLGEQSH
jgi:uncharacterized membrane protein HdeD (DUF308 family)